MGYLAYNGYISDNGHIDIRTAPEWDRLRTRTLRERRAASAKSGSATPWTLLGPTFMRTKADDLIDDHINVYSLTQCLSQPDVLYAVTESGHERP